MMSGARPGDALAGLRRRWWGCVGAALLVLVSGFALLARLWSPQAAWRWALPAAAGLTLELALLRSHLTANHPPQGGELWPDFGPANALTILRGFSAAALTGFLALPKPPGGVLLWFPALLHLAAIAPDFFDGYIARKTGRVSELGIWLDMESDSLAMLAGALLAVKYARLPWWFALVGLARYLYVLLLWLRRRHGLPIRELPPSLSRRTIAGLMMGFVNIALWPVLDVRAVTLAGALLAAPLLIGFGRDALVVAGQVDPAGARYRRADVLVTRVLSVGLAVLRVVGAVAALAFLAPSLSASPAGPWMALLAPLAALAGILLALGIVPRIAALLLLVAGAFDLYFGSYRPYHAALLVSALPVLIFGPGGWALWQPEAQLFAGRAGKPS